MDNINAKLQLEIAACYHLGKLNPLRQEWMAEYGIDTDTVELIEEEVVEREPAPVRRSSRSLPAISRDNVGWR